MPDPAADAGAAEARRPTAQREVSLPGLRRRGALESGQAGADLPVLRHRVAGDAADARRRHGHRRARSGRGASQHSRRGARLAGGEDLGPVPELPGDFGLRSRQGRAALRLLRIDAARAVRTGQGRVPARVAAAAEDLRVAGARSDSRAGTGASGSRRTRFNAQALTDTVKGIYLPYWTFDAKADARWTAEAGTYYYVTANGKQTCGRCAGRRPSGELSHVFDDDLVCASLGVHAGMLRASSRFRPTRLDSVRPRLSGRLDRRALSDRSGRPRRTLAAADGGGAPAAVRRSRCPATRIATCTCTPTYRDQTFKHILVPVWLLTYTYGATSYQVVVNGVTGRSRAAGRGAGSRSRCS